MSQQKPFYELEKPVKHRFAVSVVDITDKKEGETPCNHLVCIYNKQQEIIGGLACEANITETAECICCGNFFCNDHLSDTRFYYTGKIWSYSGFLCLSCDRLTDSDIEMIIRFREEMSQ